jgi:hypothetical protein
LLSTSLESLGAALFSLLTGVNFRLSSRQIQLTVPAAAYCLPIPAYCVLLGVR